MGTFSILDLQSPIHKNVSEIIQVPEEQFIGMSPPKPSDSGVHEDN
jgi:hypothetical protein